MIDRYALYSTLEEITQTLKLPPLNQSFELKQHYNACPTQILPIVTNKDPKINTDYIWGGTKSLAKNKPLSVKLINHQINLTPSATSHKLISTNRCLIPCNGFFLWKQVAKKRQIPYFFKPTNHSILLMAGTWEAFEDIDGQNFNTFRLLTKATDQFENQFGHDLPIFIPENKTHDWLSNDFDYKFYFNLLTESAVPTLIHFPVTPNIQYEEANNINLIRPSTPADQMGNYSLFD
ncbi:MAG: SOS response-associated peptidase family protein [Cyclobacteriaceae bacterium]